MAKRHKKHRKDRVIYRNIKSKEADYEKIARAEIEKLSEIRRKNIETTEKAKEGKKGFGRFLAGFGPALQRANINAQINQRRKFLRAKQDVRNIKTSVEVEKAKEELAVLRRKRMVTSEDIFGGTKSNVKKVNFGI